MAIVPQYQGGAPQVGSNGGSGFVAAHAPEPNYDYGRVLKESMRPVEDFANSLSKTLETNHIRTVKAESDDAERQVMEMISTRMYDPENGFMSKEGKNAMDEFDSVVEGMNKDVNQVLGALQPQVREAVGSRLQERLQSAVTQAGRWNGEQTRAYHMTSSQARVSALNADAANHYADVGYMHKSWASIQTELDYQASMRGLPPEAVTQLKEQHYGLFQATRFEAWAKDDPVGALAAFKQESAQIPADIRTKIDDGLFSQSRDQLAWGLAQQSLIFDENGEPTKLSWLDDPMAATGVQIIDGLSKNQRMSVILKARTIRSSMISDVREGFKVETANNLALALNGENPQPLSLDQFVSAYGAKNGQKIYEQYRIDFDSNIAQSDFRLASDSDILETLKVFKPSRDSENYALEMKRYQGLVRAAEEVTKARREDKVGYAIANGVHGFEPLNWGQAGKVVEQLRFRANNMDSYAQRWGGVAQLLSKDEATGLVKALDGATVDDRVQILKTISVAVGDGGIASLASQLKDGAAQYGIAASAMTETPKGAAMSVGEMYLRGKDAIDQKRVKIDDTAVLGLSASVFSALGANDDGDAVFDNPAVLAASKELVVGVAGYKILSGGSANEAIETAIGKIESHNGKKIVMPSRLGGLFGDDFEDIIEAKAKEISSSKQRFYVGSSAYTSEQFAKELPHMKLQTYARLPSGGVSYLVLRNGATVMDAKTNQPFILSVE